MPQVARHTSTLTILSACQCVHLLPCRDPCAWHGSPHRPTLAALLCAGTLVCHDFVQRRNSDMCTRVFLASPSPNAAVLREQYREVAPESRFIEFADRLASKLACVPDAPARCSVCMPRLHHLPRSCVCYDCRWPSSVRPRVLGSNRAARRAMPVLVLVLVLVPALVAVAHGRRRQATAMMVTLRRGMRTRGWGCATMATLGWVRRRVGVGCTLCQHAPPSSMLTHAYCRHRRACA